MLVCFWMKMLSVGIGIWRDSKGNG